MPHHACIKMTPGHIDPSFKNPPHSAKANIAMTLKRDQITKQYESTEIP